MTSFTTVFESRATVGLVPPESRPRIPGPVSSVTIHWNGPAVKITVAHAHSMCREFWRGVQRFHMNSRGWADIAYTVGVCQHGIVMAGRGIGVRTAANGTQLGNDTSYAIYGLIGEGEIPSDAMKHAILDAAEALGQSKLRPHDFWKATGCPGTLKSWVLAGAPRPGGSTPAPAPSPEEIDMALQDGPDIARWQQNLNFVVRTGDPVPTNGTWDAETRGRTDGWRKVWGLPGGSRPGALDIVKMDRHIHELKEHGLHQRYAPGYDPETKR